MFIYLITNSLTQKTYVGKTTKSIEERFLRHQYNASYGIETHLYRSMRKHGIENFTIKVLEETDKLDERECYWIDKLSPDYNMTRGGEGGDTSRSPNYIKGMKSRKHPHAPTFGMTGKSHTNESKSKIGKKNSNPVFCEGVIYQSIKEAEQAYPNIKVRYRLDSPKYPQFYRIKEKRVCSKQSCQSLHQ